MHQDQLLEDMCDAFSKTGHYAIGVDQTLRTRMDAARKVCVEEMKQVAIKVANKKHWHETTIWEFLREFDKCLKPKSAEERVTLTRFSSPACLPAIQVLLDGKVERAFEVDEERHAHIYRIGLIQILKEHQES